MKKYILAFLLLVFTAIALGFPYIKDYFSKSLDEYVAEQRLVGVGSTIAQDFLIIDRAGSEFSLTDVFPDGLLLMTYNRKCPACLKAVAYMEVHLEKSANAYVRPFAVLEFTKEMDHDLKALKNVQAFMTTMDQSNSVFRGKASPQFFLIDNRGVVQTKVIGWSELEVKRLLNMDI